MAWIITASSLLPSAITSASVGSGPPPSGAIEVDSQLATAAADHPYGYVLKSSIQVVSGENDTLSEKIVYRLEKAPTTLKSAQEFQWGSIKQAFASAANANVTDSNGITWEGGKDSGSQIFLGCQLAQQSGATTIILYDINKAPHSMTIAEGMSTAALIGATYQKALGTKNGLYAQISAATSVSDAMSVIWP